MAVAERRDAYSTTKRETMSTMILQSCHGCSGEFELQLEELDYDDGAEYCPDCRWIGYEIDDDVMEIPVGLLGREF